MRKYAVILSLLILAVTSFGQSKEDANLKSLITIVTTAQQDYRPDVLDKHLTSDYIEISPIGEFDTRDKVLGFYKPELKPPADKMTATTNANDFNIRVYEKFAVVIAKLDFTVKAAGKEPVTRSIRATYVCRKEKGDWKIASAQFTGIRPASK